MFAECRILSHGALQPCRVWHIILKCDIFIDDKIENLTGGDIKILYTAYHNKSISDEELKKLGIIRAKDWLDIKRILIDSMEV